MIKIKRRASAVSEMTGDIALSPILQRIYHNRGICPSESLEKGLAKLYPVSQLKNAKTAAIRLYQALKNDEHILIIGDFDSDGATSTAVAVRALSMFGAKKVSYLVPNRFDFGYGLSPEIVDVAYASSPNLIMTVDNGISSHEGVLRAKALGLDVIITDHHLAGKTLPEADVIVNPNQADDDFPSKNLAGVGVIYYVMLALRSYLRELNWFLQAGIPEPNMGDLLDLVALGTVADVVPLDKNNRILVYQGLARIRQGKVCTGIKALLQIANRQPTRLVASDFAFAVAPRLNAAGRLDDMTIGIQCLLSDNEEEALHLAKMLDSLNEERKTIETQMQAEAFLALEQLSAMFSTQLPMGVALYQADWHQGVIGILASRVKDKLHRPVIVFAKGQTGELKGSCRSIAGIHIRDILADMVNQYPDLILKFGGHAMAAGLSIEENKLEHFKKVFAEEVSKHLTPDQLERIIYTDGGLSAELFSLDLAEQLKYLEPWGQHFPEPVFDDVFHVHHQRLVGKNHLKLMLGLPESDKLIDAIAFNVDTRVWPNYRCEKVHVAYRLDINEFRGRQDLQLVIEHLEPMA